MTDVVYVELWESMEVNKNVGLEDDGSGGAYRAFLLRCWQEDVGGEPSWRFTLLEAGDEDGKRCFVSLEELNVFLREELNISSID